MPNDPTSAESQRQRARLASLPADGEDVQYGGPCRGWPSVETAPVDGVWSGGVTHTRAAQSPGRAMTGSARAERTDPVRPCLMFFDSMQLVDPGDAALSGPFKDTGRLAEGPPGADADAGTFAPLLGWSLERKL